MIVFRAICWTSRYIFDFTSPASITWPVVTKVSHATLEFWSKAKKLSIKASEIWSKGFELPNDKINIFSKNKTKGKIKLGYFTADFRDHAMSADHKEFKRMDDSIRKIEILCNKNTNNNRYTENNINYSTKN